MLPLLIMSAQNKRRDRDVMKLMMSHHQVKAVDDKTNEFMVTFTGPKNSIYEGGIYITRVYGKYTYSSLINTHTRAHPLGSPTRYIIQMSMRHRAQCAWMSSTKHGHPCMTWLMYLMCFCLNFCSTRTPLTHWMERPLCCRWAIQRSINLKSKNI